MSFIFSLLDCRELIWKANNAMLSEGRYIGNRCSNSAWVHGPLRWIIPWLTSLPEALPPNWWLVETESPQRKGGGPQPADQGSEETASGSSGSRQRLSGEAGLGHRRVVGCQSCWQRAPGLSPGLSAWWMGAGWQAHCTAVTWDCARPGSDSGTHRKQEIGWEKRFQYFRTRMRSSLPNWLETLEDKLYFLPSVSWPRKPSSFQQPLLAALWLLNTHLSPHTAWGQPFRFQELYGEGSDVRD